MKFYFGDTEADVKCGACDVSVHSAEGVVACPRCGREFGLIDDVRETCRERAFPPHAHVSRKTINPSRAKVC